MYHDMPPVTLLFPETVKIAVFPHSRTLVNAAEIRFGSLTGFEKFPVRGAVSGNDLYPFDVMLFFHGMGDFADLGFDSMIRFADCGDMFFLGRIGSIFLELGHFLSAANERAGSFMDYLDHIAADLALVNFKFLCHDGPP